MITISNNYGTKAINMNGLPKIKPKKKCECKGSGCDKKEVNLNDSQKALVGKAIVHLQQNQYPMDNVYSTLLAYSTADGMLKDMEYDEAIQQAMILESMKNR